MLGRLLVVVLFAAFASVSSARAQHDVRWVVVGSTTPELSGAADSVVDSLSAALAGSRAPALTARDSARLFEERASRASHTASSDDIATLSAAVQNLELYVATSRRDAALREAQRIQTLTAGTIDTLVQQRAVAERLFAACIAVARLYLQSGDRDAARTEMFRCRQLGPDVEVHRRSQPPAVFALLDEVDGEIRARPTRTLRIETASLGCDILLNGRRVAVTPNAVRGVPMGEHRIELVCDGDEHSRFHRILLGNDDRRLRIDLDFDKAVTTDQRMRLTFESAAVESERRLAFATTIASTLDATDVLLVTPERDGVVRVDRFQPENSRIVASARVSPDLPSATFAEVVIALRNSTSIDFTSGQRARIAAWEPSATAVLAIASARPGPVRAQQEGESTRDAEAAARGEESEAEDSNEEGATLDVSEPLYENPSWLGWGLGGLGAATLGAAVGMTIYRAQLQHWVDVAESTDPDYQLRVRRRDEVTIWPFALGGIGALVTTMAIPYILPAEDGMPWWSWLVGGIGAGAAVTGGLLLALLPTCDKATSNCARPPLELGHAVVAWSFAVPLLSVPLVYAIRSLGAPSTTNVTASFGPNEGSLVFSGSF